MRIWIQYDIDSAAGFAAAAVRSKVLWTASRFGGCAAGDPHEVNDDAAAAIDRTTIPNFDPVRDHVAAAGLLLQPLLLYLRADDSADDRRASGNTAATAGASTAAAGNGAKGRT